MNSKSAFLILILISSCSTNPPRVWQTAVGAAVSEEKLAAAKEACDYDNKSDEWTVLEQEFRELSNLTAAPFGSVVVDSNIELRISDLNKRTKEQTKLKANCWNA